MENRRGKLIPILLRFYESKRISALVSFTIKPRFVREVREYGSQTTARIRRKNSSEMKEVIGAIKIGMIMRSNSIPLPSDSGLFKRFFEKSWEKDFRKVKSDEA